MEFFFFTLVKRRCTLLAPSKQLVALLQLQIPGGCSEEMFLFIFIFPKITQLAGNISENKIKTLGNRKIGSCNNIYIVHFSESWKYIFFRCKTDSKFKDIENNLNSISTWFSASHFPRSCLGSTVTQIFVWKSSGRRHPDDWCFLSDSHRGQ